VNELGPERRERFISIAEKKKEKLKMQLGWKLMHTDRIDGTV
jgi:hypothetical protein